MQIQLQKDHEIHDMPMFSDLRTFGMKYLLFRIYETSERRTFYFGLTNLRTTEPFISDLQTFGLQNLQNEVPFISNFEPTE